MLWSGARWRGSRQGSGVYVPNPGEFGGSIQRPMRRGGRWLVMRGSRMGGTGRTSLFPASQILVVTSRRVAPGSGEMQLRGLG